MLKLFPSVAVFCLLQLTHSLGAVPQTGVAGAVPPAAEVMRTFQHSPYRLMAQGRVARATLVKGFYALDDPMHRTTPVFVDERVTIIKGGLQPWVDVSSGKPLPEARQTQIRKQLAERIDTSEAIALQYGSGQRKEIVVSAFDCPFCKNVERKLDKTQPDITVLLFPGALDQRSVSKMAEAHDIWCSAAPEKAWKAAVLKGVKPTDATPGCTRESQDLVNLMYLFGIRGFPSRIDSDGNVSPVTVDHL